MTDRKNERSELLGQHPIPGLIFRFSVPAIVGMVVNALYNVVDRIFLGRGVDQLAIGGVFLTFPIALFIMAFGMLIGMGGNSLSSIRIGQNRRDEAEKILGTSFTMLLLLGLVITLTVSFQLENLLRFFGASDTILPYSLDYARIIVFGCTFQLLGFGLNNFIRGEGNPKAAMLTMIIGAFVNIVLDYIFIFKFHLGIQGAALATIIGQFCSAVWVIRYFLSDQALLRLRRSTIIPDMRVFREMVSLGVTPFSMQLVASGINILFNNQLQHYGGDLATSSMGVIHSVSTMCFMPIFGLNQGLQPIIGFNHGAKKPQRVRSALRIGIIAAVFYMSLSLLVILAFPEPIVRIFISQSGDFEKIRAFVIPAMRIFNIAIPVVGYQIIAANYFQATGKPKIGFTLTMSRQVLLLLPALVILPQIFGITGIWLAMPFSDITSSLITTFFILREGILFGDLNKISYYA